MKHSWSVLALLAAACATPQAPSQMDLIAPKASEPNAFQVPWTDREPETGRFRIQPGDLFVDAGGSDDGNTGAWAAARLVREFVDSPAWDQDPRGTVYADGQDLVVRCPPEALDAVRRFIEILKARKSLLFRLKARFLSLRPDELAALEHIPSVNGGLGGVFDAEAIRGAAFERHERVVTAPSLMLYHAQKGSVRLTSDFAYIAGYVKNGAVYDPKPGMEWAGFGLEAQVVVNGADPNRWLLNVAVTSRDLPGIPSVPYIRLGGRLYEMPVALEHRVHGTFALGPGQAVLLLAPEVKALGGVAGRLESETGNPRVTLVILELDRAE